MRFTWSTLWLVLHIVSFLVAFGPDFMFPMIGAAAAKEPQHGLFATRLIHSYSQKVTTPLSFLVPAFGVALIVTKRYDFWASEWLIVASALYIVAMAVAIFILDPATGKLVKIQEGLMSGAPEAQEGLARLPKLVKTTQVAGGFLTLAVLTFIVLMVWRPGSTYLPPPVP
jgi:hypothetical protein